VALSTGADWDLLGRLIDGHNHHHGPTHSLGFAVAVGLGVWSWGRLRQWTRAARAGLLAGLAWLSHGLVDYVSCDTSLPFGPMLLWPLSQRHWIAPFPIFLETSRALTWAAVRQNVLAMAWETALLLPILVILWRMKNARSA
jgi:inner membrane protein